MNSEVTISTKDSEVLRLAGALLVYRGPGRHVFATSHEIAHDGRGRCELSSGVPITREAAAQLLAGLELSLAYRGFLPDRLLAIAPGAMVWWCPPAPRTVWFECDEDGKELGRRHGRTSHPGLVFAAAGDGTWHVFAVKGAKRPELDTPLFRAPYFNVWADRGEICTGNVALPGELGPEAIERYENAFFSSRFTHPNPGFRVKFKKGGHALWKYLLDKGPSVPFPAFVLAPAGQTLGQFVKTITKERKA